MGWDKTLDYDKETYSFTGHNKYGICPCFSI